MDYVSKHKATIMEAYDGVDFSTLPIELEERYEKEDLPYLARFVLAMGSYDDFMATYEQRTIRDIHIRDQFDLVAYMMRNSKLTFNNTAYPLQLALEYIDTYATADKLLYEMIRGSTEEKDKMYREQVIIHTYLWRQHMDTLKSIKDFIVRESKKLTTERPFITEELDYDMVEALDIYKELPVAYQVEIATDGWKDVDLLRRSTPYVLVLKLLYDITLNKELAQKHPYLIARRGDMIEIVELIIKAADEDDACMRMLANVFAEVSDIDTGNLVTKCLLFTRSLPRGTTFSDW